MAVHVGQFERAAAEIADDAVGLVNAGDDSERRELCFAPARQHRDRDPAHLFGLDDEGRAVVGVPAGGRRDRPDLAYPHGVAKRAEAHQRLERLFDGVLGEQSSGQNFSTEPGQNFFVEDRGQAAGEALVDHEAHRIRPDIDDGDRRTVIDAALGGEFGGDFEAACKHLIQGRGAASGCGAKTS